ncbi:MAG: peptidylprolyl isomerase [Nitriliruptoraceae bacterium]
MTVQLRRVVAGVLALSVFAVGCSDGQDSQLSASETEALAFIADYDSDEPAAVVGDVTIQSDWLFEAVDEMVSLRDPESTLTESARAVALKDLFTQMLSAVVVKEVIGAIATDNGVVITEADIDAQLDATRERLGGPEAFDQMLAESGVTLTVYREVLVPWEVYQQRLETSLREAYTPQEFREVRHILVETEDEATEAYNRIGGGEPFGDVAQELSLDTLSAEDGGNLGPSEQGRFVPGFEEIVWAAATGELLGPLETEFGFHVAEVTDIRMYAADELDDATRERLLVTQLERLMTEKMAAATIIINPQIGQWDRNEGTIVPF